MDPKEHVFYMRKIAQLEARIIGLERNAAELERKAAALESAAAGDPETAIRKFVILN